MLRTVARIVLGSLMAAVGIAHLTVLREEFQAQVPDWFPVDDDRVVLGSGVAEVALGSAFVLLPRHKRLVGGLLAAFYVAIFPGNLAQWIEQTDAFGLTSDRARFLRLFFQPVLIAWALWAGRTLQRPEDDES
ncbi:hypothetical protein [Nocardioides sp. GY 10127]|uniref:DoxX family protein n=1 Tax=Nocardioides sp. GY 10127 TaxID=2569762 RepID=UPI0010A7558E|nr:hypothetical protein [Nocardioides sp. GY 10127]TIC81567.1 hypothetical protein E8D37_10095 [Nocardioides sp. GY 10127]